MSTALSRRRLEWLVHARGTDLGRWPAAERQAALDLLRRSPEAQAAFAEALARDLGRDPAQATGQEDDASEADRAVFDRMQAALRRHLAPLPAALRGLCVGALIACMAAGLYLGVDSDTPDATDLFNSAQTVTFAALDQ